MSDTTPAAPKAEPTATELAIQRTELADVRSHLANERTYLAYLRTALALMSFGVTINRFSLFLQQRGDEARLQQTHFLLRDTANMGIGMVALGVLLLVWALVHYRKVHRQILESNFEPSSTSTTVLAVGVIALGAVSVVWLILG